MFRYLLKTLWRHRTRTLLTIVGATVAMFVFSFVQAVQNGLNQLTSGTDADRYLVTYQENRFCPSSSRLPESYADQIRKIDGVRDVIPIQVWTNNCRASLDVIVFHGTNPEQVQRYRSLDLIDGSWDEFKSQSNAAIVGVNVARRRGLTVGNQFSIGPLSVNVVGVFRAKDAATENLIYTGLSYLQLAQGRNAAGLVTQHEVLLNENIDPDHVAAKIDGEMRSGSVPTKTRRKGAFLASAISDLVDLIGFANWLGLACVGLVLSIVATTTVMSVQDRIKEYAVLQVIGIRPLKAMRLVLTESTILCLLGGLLGWLLAVAILQIGNFALTAEGVTIPILPSLRIGTAAVVSSFVVGLIAGIIPAIQAASVPLVKALRNE